METNRENKLYTNTTLLGYLSILGKLESLWIIVVSGLFFSIEKKWESYVGNYLSVKLLHVSGKDTKQYNTKCDTIKNHG